MDCVDCIINNNCVTKEAGEDGKWTCSLSYEGTQYDIIYDGVGVSKATFVKNSTISYIIDSAFVPTKVNECPSRDEYALIREEDDIEITWKIVSK